MKKLSFVITLYLSALNLLSQKVAYEVNLSGNAYVTNFQQGATVTQSGLEKWVSEKSVIETFVYFHKPQTITISIKGELDNESVIEVTFRKKKSRISVSNGSFEIPIETFQVRNAGYEPIKL